MLYTNPRFLELPIMTKTVVILGGSYAGLHVAHYLLKQKIQDVKVVLVSKVRSRFLGEDTQPPFFSLQIRLP